MATSNLDDSLTQAEGMISTIQNDLRRMESLTFDQRKSLDSDIEKQLQALDQRLIKMSSDIRTLPPSDRSYYEEEVKNLRSTHSKMVTELRQKRQSMMNDPAYKQNQQLLANQQRADNILNNMDEAIRIGNDSINVGQNTMSLLAEDRQKFQHIDENLMEIHMQGKKGESTAKRIVKRICFNNFIVWAIVIVLVAFLGFSLYWKLKDPKKDSDGGDSGDGGDTADGGNTSNSQVNK